MKILGKYRNGNYIVTIGDDGTKIRETEYDEFIPAFAENCDCKITDKCDGGCQWCYEGCTPSGKHGDILNPKFLDSLHPFTELAINGNDLTHPDLIPFLQKLKEKKVIANITEGTPGMICSGTYLMIGPFASENEMKNCESYMRTKFFRALVAVNKISQNASYKVYETVPMQDFSKPWTDEELYKKYNLTQEEIDFIESMIKPME